MGRMADEQQPEPVTLGERVLAVGCLVAAFFVGVMAVDVLTGQGLSRIFTRSRVADEAAGYLMGQTGGR